jgi:enoyl-[acyl-carrier protein] reductase II
MGTRMVSATESPVHEGWKDAIVAAAETDTILLKQAKGPALRALRTERTAALEAGEGNPMAALGGGVKGVYFEGDMEAGIALTGQVAGRIDSIEPVARIIADTVQGFEETVKALASGGGA